MLRLVRAGDGGPLRSSFLFTCLFEQAGTRP